MEFDFFIFLFGLIIVPFSFIFFPKLFYNKKFTIPFFLFTITLAIIGLSSIALVNNQKLNSYLFLICPLYSLTLFRILLYIFKLNLNRNPKNPPRQFLPEDDGLWWDRLFYFTFIILSLLLPTGLLAYSQN